MHKHRTVIGSHVRTGSDTMFVAPVTVGDGAYTGAGTVLREDVPPGALAVSGGPQRNIEGWVDASEPGPSTPPRPRRRAEAVERPDGNQPSTSTIGPTISTGSEWPDWTDDRKNLMLFSGRAHPELAEQVAKDLDVTITPQTAYDFANGEIFVRFEESVRGCDAFVLQSHSGPDQRVADGTADHDRRAQARRPPSGSPSSCRSTRTPGRTRSTAAASRSRPGWSPTCSRPRAPTGS